MARNIAGELNLAIWRSSIDLPKIYHVTTCTAALTQDAKVPSSPVFLSVLSKLCVLF